MPKCSAIKDQAKKFNKKISSPKYHLIKLENISLSEIMLDVSSYSRSRNHLLKSKTPLNTMLSFNLTVANLIPLKVSKSLKQSLTCIGSGLKESTKNSSLQIKEISKYGNFTKNVSKK